MANGARLTIRTREPDPRAAGLLADAHALGLTEVTAIDVADVVFFAGSLTAAGKQQMEAVLVDPLADNRRAQAFYQRLGFVPLGTRRFGADLCEVHRLERDDWLKHRPPSSVTEEVSVTRRVP